MFFDSDLSSTEVLQKLGRIKPAFGFRTTWGYLCRLPRRRRDHTEDYW